MSHTIERDAKILNPNYPGSNAEKAKKLRMSLEDYLNRKHFLLNQQGNAVSVLRDLYITELEDKITSTKINNDTGLGTVEGLFTTEPQSAEEIIVRFKLDTSKWRLSGYWNKQQPDGRYLVSANITQLKGSEVSNSDIQDVLKKVFTNNTIKPQSFVKEKTNEKSLMVYTSDKHVGAFVPGEGLYKNDYNCLVFANRMQKLLQEIIYLTSIYGRFESIYIMDLGDSMDGLNGQTTRGGHGLPQNMTNKDAFEVYVRTHKDFFDQIVSNNLSNNIQFIAVTNDNHSNDFGYFTIRALEEYLNIKYPDLKTTIAKKFITHFVLGEHTFLLCHGKDSEDMKHGLPIHINDKTENFINYYLDYNNIDSKKTQIHFVKGDLHQDTSESAAKFTYRNTLSMFGSSKWAMHNFIPQAPGVSFDIVENNTKRVYEYKLQFDATASVG